MARGQNTPRVPSSRQTLSTSSTDLCDRSAKRKSGKTTKYGTARGFRSKGVFTCGGLSHLSELSRLNEICLFLMILYKFIYAFR